MMRKREQKEQRPIKPIKKKILAEDEARAVAQEAIERKLEEFRINQIDDEIERKKL